MDEDIFWGERNPKETEALICLVDAEACLGKAMLNGSVELYEKALKLSEKVIEYFPQCAIAHYFTGYAHLKAKGDKNYAEQKCQLLLSHKSKDANILAKKLKDEIEGIKGILGTD